MRGENCLLAFYQVTGVGSSPHARGKQQKLNNVAHVFGLIPACAGKTPEFSDSS